MTGPVRPGAELDQLGMSEEEGGLFGKVEQVAESADQIWREEFITRDLGTDEWLIVTGRDDDSW